MNAHARARRPAAFNVDDPALVLVTPLDETHRRTAGPVGGANAVTDPGALVPADRDTVVPATRTAAKWRRRMPWATMFWIAAGGLVLLATALGITDLIEELARRAEWLGGIGLGLAIIGGIALAAIVLREAAGLYRLAEIDKLRERAVAILVSDDRTAGRALGRELIVVTRRMPRLARPRARLESHLGDIIDGGDLVRLAERELMAPLDEEARRLVSAAARRVSVVTAVSPRAAVDMFFVLITALGLVRRLALLYGGRPGTLGLLKLMRQAISHLALTGGMAASDSLIQQVIGHGLAAKLSARLGEGILNGLLTARLGLAAIEATRPLPFAALRQPALNDLAGALLRAPEISGTEEALPDQRSQ
jgi:putative membrane protein